MIRPPAVAGRFYPSDPAQLAQELDSFLAGEIHKSKIRAQACMVPHAGYKYSGHVAGAVYGRMEIPGRVILVGPRHFPRGASFAILSDGAWKTPLGLVPIDHSIAEKLCAPAHCSVRILSRMSPSTHLKFSCHFCSGSLRHLHLFPS